ncbi:CwfJ domain-containing protein [Bimuria novae-zelandiae CBS 107.79]|uniref:CwfJ domain-containing protein n=1 Tax=Bimuria novae-zelandiae CBS 107.79 TaxID=1447943 RepID=A0A6A5VVI3_9PLEO|nr:CwfJ domain-containing protein [Bimuria novae-zelandiae CBS 107.79]
MASKIAVIGDVNGHFPAVLGKLATLHAKQNFALVIIAGNLFASPSDATEEDAKNVQLLIDGKIDIPVPTYFALGSNAFPKEVVEKLASSDDELCHNLHFLGKRTTMKTSEGIRIVALGSQLDPNIIAGQSQDKYPPFYSDTDAKVLHGATTADILITSEWPEGIRSRSKVAFNPDVQPSEQQCIADLDVVLKPRYHFSTSGPYYYEREPFFHAPGEDTENLFPVTRFISLASYGNPHKQKWIYAFSLDPTTSHPVAPPSGSTMNPLIRSDKKRVAPDKEQALVYDDGHRGGRKGNKRRKHEPRGPIDASQCFFCLSNANIATHLISSIGDSAYLTTAKGPLPTSQTFPKLGFPCHLLIIPFSHQPTLASMEEEERHSTYTEMQKYRTAMNRMLQSRGEGDYGSVTWEVSKASLPHTHWQYMPIPTSLVRKGLVEAAFTALAENFHWPPFAKQDVGDGAAEATDFFRVLIWDPADPPEKQTSLVLRFDEKVRFQVGFGREVVAKLLRLDGRVDWKDCAQVQGEEERDVENFKKAFGEFDFTGE